MFTATNRNTSTVFSNACLKYLNFKHFHLLVLLITFSATKGVGQTYFNRSSGNYSEPFTAWSSHITKLPFAVNNNVAKSASISVNLPKALNNQDTVKLRFYYHNGGSALASPTGSRPKISIDNVGVKAVSAGPNLLVTSDFTPEIKSIKSGNWNDPTT